MISIGLGQAIEPEKQYTVDAPMAVIMGPVTQDGVRFSVMAKPNYQLAMGVIQYRVAGTDDWSATQVFPLARAKNYVDVTDLTDLRSATKYEYRCGVFYISDQSELSNATLSWAPLTEATYVYETFYSYSNLVGSEAFALVFGSCQYDGPLLDCLENSPLSIINWYTKRSIFRKLGLASKILTIPGLKNTIGGSVVGNLLTMFSLAEQEGEFIRTDDSQIFRTVIEFIVQQALRNRGFIDMGDTYYRDWLNKYAGAYTAEEVQQLIVDAVTTPGRSELQRIVPTTVLIDDHAIADNFTGADLRDGYTQLDDTCWRLADLVQRQSPIYDSVSGHIGYRWYETEYYGLPAFVGDFRSEAFPNKEKISQRQLQAIKAFIKKWGKHPKLLISQIPIGPDQKGEEDSDKWGNDLYKETRTAILDSCATPGVANTFWLGGDIHAGMFNEIVTTKRDPQSLRLRHFNRIESYPKLVVDMTNVVLAQAVASPFNWPIQFESLALDPMKPLGTSGQKSYCIVNQSDLIRQNHAGILRMSADGHSMTAQLIGPDPDNAAGRILLERTYMLVPYH
jgi:hypothetical protein